MSKASSYLVYRNNLIMGDLAIADATDRRIHLGLCTQFPYGLHRGKANLNHFDQPDLSYLGEGVNQAGSAYRVKGVKVGR